MPLSNHQATDSKKNKFTIIVLESVDPYLPDQVEFKHTSLLDLRQNMSITNKKDVLIVTKQLTSVKVLVALTNIIYVCMFGYDPLMTLTH